MLITLIILAAGILVCETSRAPATVLHYLSPKFKPDGKSVWYFALFALPRFPFPSKQKSQGFKTLAFRNLKCRLPAEMREGFVSLGHLVNFVTLADGVPCSMIGFEDFRRKRGLHRLALGRLSANPQSSGARAHSGGRQRGFPAAPDTWRRQHGGPWFQCAAWRCPPRVAKFQSLFFVSAGFFSEMGVERAVNDALRRAFLAGNHHGVYEAADQRVSVLCRPWPGAV